MPSSRLNSILLIVSIEINFEGLFLIVPVIKAENITAIYSSVKVIYYYYYDHYYYYQVAQKISNSLLVLFDLRFFYLKDLV